MDQLTKDYLKRNYGIDYEVSAMADEAEKEIAEVFARYESVAEYNQYKVLRAFHDNYVSDTHFAWANGYGHDDPGRAVCGKVFASAFETESCIVGPFICDGTHALACCYLGLLRPGDELLYCTGEPYDTMETVIGLKGDGNGSLKSYGVSFSKVELTADMKIDIEGVKAAIRENTKVAVLQRSIGYSFRHAFSIPEIREWAAACKSVKPDVICMVDNCYGEFLDTKEPVAAGADIMAGSLMKNPGGGIAMGGGYVAGRADLVETVSYRVIAPGIGTDAGLMYDQTRRILQGIFMAPRTVCEAIKGAALFAKAFEKLGYEVSPRAEDPRNDVVTAIRMKSEEQLTAFCEGVQAAAPINAHYAPEAGEMAGYEDSIIMASGSFVQGSTMELSADAPLREPYTAYFQGALSYDHAKFGLMKVLQSLKDRGLL
ncbi:MAG: methionine gamma-lyase family protein [Firmicutes bacterium]|nr:methionine gamma-lyase family protein [Bacillota bacterium]